MRTTLRRAARTAPFLLCLTTSTFAFAQDVPVTASTDWPAYGGGPAQIRYSTLKQIDRANASRLRVAWTFDTGDAFPGSEFQCNPLVIGGVLYAVTPSANVVALDAANGTLKWRFNPDPAHKPLFKIRLRGVTWWSDGNQARIFTAWRQYLYSLDAQTGEPDPHFGNNGHIDLRDNLGREPRNMVSLTTPGIVYKDLLIVGSLISETLPASPGDIRAYDVRTGKLRWIFHTIPRPGEFGYDTWPKDAWTYIGSANNWSGMSLDTQRGILFVPTGSAAFDFYGANRTGDDLFANSLVALKADTGERVWHTAIPRFIGGIALAILAFTIAYIDVPLAVAAFSVALAGVVAAYPPLWAIPGSVLSISAAAAGIGLISSLGNLGGFAGPYIIGYISDRTGTYAGGLWAIAAALFLSGMVALMVSRKRPD